ncbi:hypothetical protein FLA105534_04340 [Flavobacterium bizetiae]|uniref:Uncharacterized protein n=1 Tax=Flavobacterium bizetiae TaxID=2704140 RepID=A0A6J4GXQ9_9FLAO|nr:hypothetical protein FLA105534_04340 [Flavobacterium bizetiae]CAD5343583.1 hypothetical protein FLA105535_03583 [Flavobacterium bizetiae]CAD5349578.1 hypothetical protein FLA105534_03564 [Flavobacterium bizetiae]
MKASDKFKTVIENYLSETAQSTPSLRRTSVKHPKTWRAVSTIFWER